MNGNSQVRLKKNVVSLALLLAGSLLWGFSMGRWLAPLAAWIGPVLVMRYARDHKVWRGYALVLSASILATSIGFLSIWLGALPPPMVPFLAVGIGFLWSVPYLADRLLNGRLRGFWSTFVYPLAVTTVEFSFIHFNPLGTWGATGFTQYGVLPLMQLASVTGAIGITFLMGWFASVANWAWENRSHVREIRGGLATFGVVAVAVFLFGFLRLNLATTSETEETIRVAGITAVSGFDYPDFAEFLLAVDSIRNTYFDETVREAQAGARLIVWPELSGSGQAEDDAAFIARAQEVARQNGIYLTLPLGSIYPAETGKPKENKLLLIDPAGETVMEHVKFGGNFLEGSLRGDGVLQTVTAPFGVLSGVICWDLDFPAVIQQAGLNGTGLMLVPSGDWFEIDPVHSQMAVFRAIENGMSVVRQTHGGLSIAVDPYGHVLAQTDFFGATDRTMVAQVPVRHVATLYTLFGRWLEWAFVAGFLLIVAWALVARRPAT